MPEDARALGFSDRPVPHQLKSDFTLTSIATPTRPISSFMDALDCIMGPPFLRHLLRQACVAAAESKIDLVLSEESVRRYVASVMAHGVANYANERLAYVDPENPDSSCFGLGGNRYLRSLFTLQEWKGAKKLFAGDRDFMTNHFNSVLEANKVPSR